MGRLVVIGLLIVTEAIQAALCFSMLIVDNPDDRPAAAMMMAALAVGLVALPAGFILCLFKKFRYAAVCAAVSILSVFGGALAIAFDAVATLGMHPVIAVSGYAVLGGIVALPGLVLLASIWGLSH